MAAFPQHGLGGNGAAGGGMGHGQGNGGGQGSAGQGGGAHEGHGPVGTEYTLQGVMRFLQIEWHAHERARNSWDIERAEMKAKIAKQEGECRQAKRINEQLSRQIKMLESALRAERAKTKAGVSDGRPATPDKNKEEAEKDGILKKQNAQGDHRPGSNAPHNSFLQTEAVNDTSAKEQEQYLDNTTKHLKNCMQEIQYLLTPPQIPPPLQGLVNGNSTGLPNPGQSPEDAWTNYARMPRSMPSMQGEQMKASAPSLGGGQPVGTSLPWQYQHPDAGQPQRPLGPEEPLPTHPDEQVETVTHAFDASGRAIPAEPDMRQLPRHVNQLPEADGWTFDEGQPQQLEAQPPEVPPRRPDTDLFPSAANATHLSAKSPPRNGPQSHRRKSSGSQAMSRRRSSQGKNETHDLTDSSASHDPNQFKVRFALRGHLDVVRSVIFSGGGSPSEPEVCTAGDDGTIKRWIVPASYSNFHAANNGSDLDITAYFTHRGHEGIVTSLATCPASTGFSTGGRANGDGWIFSGGQDATVRVWERGRVDPKATLEGHTDTVWCVCVLPATVGAVFGPQSSNFGGPDRLLLVSGSADGTVKVWAVSAPPQGSSPSTNTRRGVGGSRRHSVTSGSNFPSSPQPSVASATIFGYTLIHSIERPQMDESRASPTCICPLSPSGETFVVSYTDSSVLIFDTRSGEELIGMASNETYDGSMATSINAVVATSHGMEGDAQRGIEPEELGAGATGSREGIEGMVISGHEDRFVRFFDANSGQCTYTMLAHPSAISALALSKDGREAVSAGHDASIRFWSLEKRICTQDLVSHRPMRGEGVCDVAWSQDGRLVVSAGGDGVVKVFAR